MWSIWNNSPDEALIFFQASSFQLLKLENLLRLSFFTFNVKSCCVRVGSGVQTDATTPNIVDSNNVESCCVRVGSGVQTDATTPNIVGSNNVESCWVRVGSGVQTPLLLRSCWQWCAKGCNNSQQCWDLDRIVGRIQPIRLWRPCVTNARAQPQQRWKSCANRSNVFWSHASAITEQKNVGSCWPKSLTAFNLCATTPNNTQKHITAYNRVWNGRNM